MAASRRRREVSEAEHASVAYSYQRIAEFLRSHFTTMGKVEREDQRALLAAMSCDTVQGYLLAHPMPKVDLENWLRKRA